jgi:hypothetical protein
MSGDILWAVIQHPFHAIPRLHGEVVEYCHHLTLQRGNINPELRVLEGVNFSAEILFECWSVELGVQALLMDLPNNIKWACQNNNPHVTLFCQNGVKPFLSNTMLESFHHKAKPTVKSLDFQILHCTEENIATEQLKSMRIR